MTAAELSLDAPVDRSDKDAATLGERFAGQEGGEIEEKTDGKLMREFIDRIFQKYLTPRERKILYLYYGLEEGSEAMTLEKIGARSEEHTSELQSRLHLVCRLLL